MDPTPLLLVLSGPSGVGKDAVLSRMRQPDAPYHFTVTATTRKIRVDEVDGADYIFLSEREFRRMIDGDELLEWAEVHGNLYGIPRAQVAEALERGLDVILKIDVQGAATIKRLAPGAVLVFLVAPSMEELARRLGRRMTETPDALRIRLQTAQKEMAEAPKFDHVICNRNDRLDDTVREIEAAISSERRKGTREKIVL
jgi:guanylate kinase